MHDADEIRDAVRQLNSGGYNPSLEVPAPTSDCAVGGLTPEDRAASYI
jgi:hypothetical protein